jgi:hypothetical protein
MTDSSTREPWLVSGGILAVALVAAVLLIVRNPLKPLADRNSSTRRTPNPPKFPVRPNPPHARPRQPDDRLPLPRKLEEDEVLPLPRPLEVDEPLPLPRKLE